jgi:hypothetical protein
VIAKGADMRSMVEHQPFNFVLRIHPKSFRGLPFPRTFKTFHRYGLPLFPEESVSKDDFGIPIRSFYSNPDFLFPLYSD